MEFLIITGMSGAGKSQAMNVLEDMGYYCVDNLPPILLNKFAELCLESKNNIDKAALVVDTRGGKFFDSLFESLDRLKAMGVDYKILYLDAKDEILIKRYKELRRPHPLNPSGSILEGIKIEKSLLKRIKSESNYIIDTSKFTLGMLKEEIYSIFLEKGEERGINIIITSFGYKNGILVDGDLIFDVRFLPNPYYISELKEVNGNNKETRDYVLKWPQTNLFIDKLVDMLDFLIPYYIQEGKNQLVIGIGCTGGFHRSVAISNRLGEILKDKGNRVTVSHRELR